MYEIFPESIAYGALGGPKYNTAISMTASGHEKRVSLWPEALCEYNVAHNIKSENEFAELLSFFRGHKGRRYCFRFKDWSDHTEEQIINLSSKTNRYSLYKTYFVNDSFYEYRKIYSPDNASTILTYSGGLLNSGFIVTIDSGYIWFIEIPNGVETVTAAYNFYVMARFGNDAMPSRYEYLKINSWEPIIINEVRYAEISSDWSRPDRFNWTFDNMGGCSLTATVSGIFGGAMATPFDDGGVWKVRIADPLPGGGNIKYVRGVWRDDVEFGWDGFWANQLTEGSNYYDSFGNESSYTDILLTENPGGAVQIYYIYNTGLFSAKYDGLNNWPTVQKWKRGPQYTIVDAVDKYFELIVTLLRETAARGNDNYPTIISLWSEYMQYSPIRTPPLILDNFRRELFDDTPLGIFRNSTIGQIAFIGTEIDSYLGTRYLKLVIGLPGSDDSAWYGYALNIENVSDPPWDEMDSISFRLRCFNSGARLSVQINNAKQSDGDKFTNPAYLYWHTMPDINTSWKNNTISFDNFWSRKNIYDDGDRVRGSWWVSGGVVNIEDYVSEFDVADEVFYTCKRISFGGSSWGLCGVGSGGTYQADPSDQSTLRFLMKSSSTVHKDIEIQVMQDGDSSPRTASLPKESLSESWSRHSIDFSAFSPAIENTKSITWIQWFWGEVPPDGTVFITDVTFGEHITYQNNKENLLLFQFYTENQGINEQQFDLTNITMGLNIDDPYPHVPTWGLSRHDYGEAAYNGPGFVHYCQPLAPHLIQNDETKQTWIKFIIDSQAFFYSAYGILGPVMGVHTRNFVENITLLGSSNFNSFCWWADYPEIGNGYVQYWTFSKAAEYYYFTGDVSIKPFLENWLSWFNDYIVEDAAFPSDPKGYKMPTGFTDGVISYEDYNPYFAAPIAEGMLYYYWREGDIDCSTWVRRFLNDLRANRWDSLWGGYIGEGAHQAHGNGRILKLFGMVVAGRYPRFGLYDFDNINEDSSLLEELSAWMFRNSGDTKPNVLNSDMIPFGHAGDFDSWYFAPNYIYPKEMSTTEAVVVMMAGALEYARAKQNFVWYDKLKKFLLNIQGGFQ